MSRRNRFTSWLAGAALLVCVGASAAQPDAQRGQYLARAADCMSCHTAAGGQQFAGGGALDTPFGKIYAPNITPDPHSGIGSWSEADFTRALRDGVGKDGELLYPAMPYANYTKISDADVAALWAYLRSVPPSTHIAPHNTLAFPFNIRTGLAVWQSLYFQPGRWQLLTSKDAAWNRGAYLVQALGHCDMCHTPRNVAQATESKHYLTGAQISGWYAPDISSDPLSQVRDWSTDELAAFLKSGQSPGNVRTAGPMAEVVHDSLRYLTDSDLHAIAVYLKDQPAVETQQAARPAPEAAQSIAQGKIVYDDYCSSCHQSNGKGVRGVVPALAGDGALLSREPYNVIMPLLEGIKAHGPWGAMGSFANTLSDAQIADVSNYVRSAWGNRGEPDATPNMVGNWRQVAVLPAHGEPAALICPVLPSDQLLPAMREKPEYLRQAAQDHAKLTQLVAAYTAARPQSSTAQVIEALSTAYCRAVAANSVSSTVTGAQVADFSQQLAIALTRTGAGASSSNR
jgi:mono/diheme cytochrome c family protein